MFFLQSSSRSYVGANVHMLVAVHIVSIIPVIFQAQFSQVRPVTMMPNVGPRVPIYPPGAPGMGQQIFYGQTPPTLVPPQVPFSLFFCVCVLFLLCGA